MPKFTDHEIKSFIGKYENRQKSIESFLTHSRDDSVKSALNAVKEKLDFILIRLNELNVTVFQFNHFKMTENASSELHNYFTEGLTKIDLILTSAENAKNGRKASHPGGGGFEAAGYTLGGIAAAIIIIGILGGAGLMSVAWIAIPIVLLICAVAAIVYICVNDCKVREQGKKTHIAQLEKDLSTFDEHVKQLDSLNEPIEKINQEVQERVNFNFNENEPGRDPSYNSLKLTGSPNIFNVENSNPENLPNNSMQSKK